MKSPPLLLLNNQNPGAREGGNYPRWAFILCQALCNCYTQTVSLGVSNKLAEVSTILMAIFQMGRLSPKAVENLAQGHNSRRRMQTRAVWLRVLLANTLHSSSSKGRLGRETESKERRREPSMASASDVLSTRRSHPQNAPHGGDGCVFQPQTKNVGHRASTRTERVLEQTKRNKELWLLQKEEVHHKPGFFAILSNTKPNPVWTF